MAKKTWVKLKRGLLIDPKHRMALGTNIWLYLYMLDVTDWDTGKIIDWHDQAAADELMMPVGTVRYQRRKLEDAGYISCQQLYQRQVITIKRWVNPREYSGKVYNDDGKDWDVDDDGDEELAPFNDDGDKHGVKDGVNDGANGLTPVHINHIPHITVNKKGEPDLFDACVEIYKQKKHGLITDAHAFTLMINNFKANGVTAEDYAAAIDAMDADDRYKGGKPTSYEKWAIGYAEKRLNPSKPTNRTTQPVDNIALLERMHANGEL